MVRITAAIFLAFTLDAGVGWAADFTGTYTLQTSDGLNTLTIRQDGTGAVKGTLQTDDGSNFEVSGTLRADQNSIAGLLTTVEKGLFFEARSSGAKLTLRFIPPNESGEPDPTKAQEHVFTRQGGPGPSSPPSTPQGGEAANLNPLAAGSPAKSQDPFIGTFADPRLRLQLSQAANGYAGNIQFNGQTFPATAQKAGPSKIRGKFTSGSNTFDFEGSLQASEMTLSTGGTTYNLQRQSSAAAIPAKSDAPTATAPAPPALAGSRSLSDPHMGVQFPAPSGWKEEKSEGMFVLKSPPHEGAIIVVSHSMNSLEELQAQAAQSTSFGQGSEMTPSSEPRSLGTNAVAVDYSGNVGGQPAQARAVAVLSPHGGGATIIYLAESGQYNAPYAALTESIARGMRFSKPQTSPQAHTWANRLKGHRLAYMASGGSSSFGAGYTGWSESKDIYLCSDGAFQSSSSFQGAADIGGGSSGYVGNNPDAQGGRWRITSQGGQSALELRSQDGSTVTFRLEMDGTKTLLNGKRYFVVENPACQ